MSKRKFNVFDTQSEAVTAEQQDYELWRSNLDASTSSEYINETTKWAEIQQRITDNKWVYAVYEQAPTAGRIHEEYADDWFTTET